MTPRQAFARALRAARLRRRLSQEGLALDAGLSRALRVSSSSLVRRVERDATRPPERAAGDSLELAP